MKYFIYRLLLTCSLVQYHINNVRGNDTQCCSSVKVSTTGISNSSQFIRFGTYYRHDTFSDRPAFKHETRDEYLFYMPGRTRGLWMIGPDVGKFSGGLANRDNTVCPENIAKDWKFADGKGWIADSLIRLQCSDEDSDCFYADDKFLEGGNEEDSKMVIVSSTVNCIDRCIEMKKECSYWSVSKSEDDNTQLTCHLKRWKGRLIKKTGYISGSLPSACFKKGEPVPDPSSSGSSNQETLSTEDVGSVATTPNPRCIYKDLKFDGGDLKILKNIKDFRLCKDECETHEDCFFFTSSHFGCFLKSQNVEIKKRIGYVSGASDAACETVRSLNSGRNEDKVEESEPRYEENEVNGKFKMMMEWDDSLSDPSSSEFADLAASVKQGLLEMLAQDPNLKDQADFDVDIISFKKGSVNCNFKIRYILKEAFAVVPFKIRPANITTSLGQGFQFKRGLLFQRFVIARGSFSASSPVDHCDAKGCSHKCAYDYDIEDYVCTCPPTLALGPDSKTCLLPDAITQKPIPLTSTEPTIKVTLLPSDCLWSVWSDWGKCSATCGESFRIRERAVVIPPKNGGECEGDSKQTFPCVFVDCNSTSTEMSTKIPVVTQTDETISTTEDAAASHTRPPRVFNVSIITVDHEPKISTESIDEAEMSTPKHEITTEYVSTTATEVSKSDMDITTYSTSSSATSTEETSQESSTTTIIPGVSTTQEKDDDTTEHETTRPDITSDETTISSTQTPDTEDATATNTTTALPLEIDTTIQTTNLTEPTPSATQSSTSDTDVTDSVQPDESTSTPDLPEQTTDSAIVDTMPTLFVSTTSSPTSITTEAEMVTSELPLTTTTHIMKPSETSTQPQSTTGLIQDTTASLKDEIEIESTTTLVQTSTSEEVTPSVMTGELDDTQEPTTIDKGELDDTQEPTVAPAKPDNVTTEATSTTKPSMDDVEFSTETIGSTEPVMIIIDGSTTEVPPTAPSTSIISSSSTPIITTDSDPASVDSSTTSDMLIPEISSEVHETSTPIITTTESQEKMDDKTTSMEVIPVSETSDTTVSTEREQIIRDSTTTQVPQETTSDTTSSLPTGTDTKTESGATTLFEITTAPKETATSTEGPVTTDKVEDITTTIHSAEITTSAPSDEVTTTIASTDVPQEPDTDTDIGETTTVIPTEDITTEIVIKVTSMSDIEETSAAVSTKQPDEFDVTKTIMPRINDTSIPTTTVLDDDKVEQTTEMMYPMIDEETITSEKTTESSVTEKITTTIKSITDLISSMSPTIFPTKDMDSNVIDDQTTTEMQPKPLIKDDTPEDNILDGPSTEDDTSEETTSMKDKVETTTMVETISTTVNASTDGLPVEDSSIPSDVTTTKEIDTSISTVVPTSPKTPKETSTTMTQTEQTVTSIPELHEPNKTTENPDLVDVTERETTVQPEVDIKTSSTISTSSIEPVTSKSTSDSTLMPATGTTLGDDQATTIMVETTSVSKAENVTEIDTTVSTISKDQTPTEVGEMDTTTVPVSDTQSTVSTSDSTPSSTSTETTTIEGSGICADGENCSPDDTITFPDATEISTGKDVTTSPIGPTTCLGEDCTSGDITGLPTTESSVTDDSVTCSEGGDCASDHITTVPTSDSTGSTTPSDISTPSESDMTESSTSKDTTTTSIDDGSVACSEGDDCSSDGPTTLPVSDPSITITPKISTPSKTDETETSTSKDATTTSEVESSSPCSEGDGCPVESITTSPISSSSVTTTPSDISTPTESDETESSTSADIPTTIIDERSGACLGSGDCSSGSTMTSPVSDPSVITTTSEISMPTESDDTSTTSKDGLTSSTVEGSAACSEGDDCSSDSTTDLPDSIATTTPIGISTDEATEDKDTSDDTTIIPKSVPDSTTSPELTTTIAETTQSSTSTDIVTTTQEVSTSTSDEDISVDETTIFIPTTSPSSEQTEITTVESITSSTTQQVMNVTTVKRIESTEEIIFVTTTKKPEILDTTTMAPTETQEQTTEQISNEIVPPTDPEDNIHIMRCKLMPSTSMVPTTDGTTPLSCKDEAKEDAETFIVMITISADDLKSVLTKNVKIVVKDFMLMNMPTNGQSSEQKASPK